MCAPCTDSAWVLCVLIDPSVDLCVCCISVYVYIMHSLSWQYKPRSILSSISAKKMYKQHKQFSLFYCLLFTSTWVAVVVETQHWSWFLSHQHDTNRDIPTVACSLTLPTVACSFVVFFWMTAQQLPQQLPSRAVPAPQVIVEVNPVLCGFSVLRDYEGDPGGGGVRAPWLVPRHRSEHVPRVGCCNLFWPMCVLLVQCVHFYFCIPLCCGKKVIIHWLLVI